MIKLKDILTIEDYKQYNVHLACWNQNDHPLNIFLKDENKYKEWQEWKGNQKEGKIVKQKFVRNRILSFAQIYYESNDLHLFTGVYDIIKRFDDRYEVIKSDLFSDFIGRLKIRYNRHRITSFLLENIIDDIVVEEITKERLECVPFEGHGKINLKFDELEIIIKKGVKDWKLKLDNLQGIYLLIDDKSGKMYIGSASGEFGIWQRWSNYVYNYTGGNKGLDDLHKEVGEEYFRKNFRFILLEYFTDKTEKDFIRAREEFWKLVFNTRDINRGYNHN